MTTDQDKEQRFEDYRKEILDNLTDAKYQFNLYRNLKNLSKSEYKSGIVQNTAFWGVILTSLEQSCVLSLSRAYDTHKDAICLQKLLNYISSNQSIFDEQYFRNRLQNHQDHQYSESLIDSLIKRTLEDRKIIKEKIDEHSRSINNQNELVKQLITIRDNVIAHRDKQILSQDNQVEGISESDFEQLVNNGLEIVNFYGSLYDCMSCNGNLVGEQDDCKKVVKSVKIGQLALDFLCSVDQEIRLQEIKKCNNSEKYLSILHAFNKFRDQVFK